MARLLPPYGIEGRTIDLRDGLGQDNEPCRQGGEHLLHGYTCSVEGCEYKGDQLFRGMCRKHYQRWYRGKDNPNREV